MTTLNGVVGIDFNLAAIIASTLLSSKRGVLIHEFDDHHVGAQTSAAELATRNFVGVVR
jgi:hypothetical protein